MPAPGPLQQLLATLGLDRWTRQPHASGIIAAVVSFDREDLSMASINQCDEEQIVARLSAALARNDTGNFDGADWSASRIQWFFFGTNANTLESVMLDALRAEPQCKGALLRVTCNGVAGPWRETKV
jgi:hypothetical protein